MNNYTNRITRLKGTPYEIGYAMGQKMGAGLERHVARYLEEFKLASDKFYIDQEKLVSEALPWLGTLPERFQDEFRGLAEGSRIPLQRIVEHTFIEQCALLRCSGLVSMFNGHAWLARNNDTVAPGMWGYVGIKEVDGRIPSISFSMECDVFTPTGINREKLWLHYNYLPVADEPAPDRPHVPPYVFMTDALETCTSIGEVEALLDTTQRSDGMMLFAVDGKTDEFAIFECGCQVHYKREPDHQRLVGTNHFCMIEDPDGPLEQTPLSTLSRFLRLEQMLASLPSKPDLPGDLIRMLADDEIERRGETFATAYANVACPHTGEIWYTFGGYPAASAGNWGMLDWPWD